MELKSRIKVSFSFSKFLEFTNTIGPCWTHIRGIANTKLLVSLHHKWDKSANMEIFDISKKAQAKKIYTLGEVSGGKMFPLLFITNISL